MLNREANDARHKDLYLKAAEGDLGAMDLLLNASRPMIKLFFQESSAERNSHDDLIQEALIRLVKVIRTRTYHPENVLWMTYVKAIARNVLFDHLRSLKRRPLESELQIDIPHRTNQGPDNNLDLSTIFKAIDDCFDTLSEKNRALVSRYYYDGLALAHLAESDGVSAKLIKGRLMEARIKIRKCLERKGFSKSQFQSATGGT